MQIESKSPARGEDVDVRHIVRVEGWELAIMAGKTEGEPEPRIRDIDLGERLRYANPIDIRKLIRRLLSDGKLNDFEVFATVAKTSEQGGRPATEYWLSEAATLKIVAKSETAIADAILDDVIRVYMLARRGLLPTQPTLPPEFIALLTQLVETQKAQGEMLAALITRMTAIESGGGIIQRAQRRAISHSVARIARGRVHTGLAPSMNSARRWIYTRLETAASWSGAGRSWDKLPAARFGLVLVELEILQREVEAALEALASRQLTLAGTDEPETH